MFCRWSINCIVSCQLAGAREEIDRRFIADKVEASESETNCSKRVRPLSSWELQCPYTHLRRYSGDQEHPEAQLADKPAAWYRSQVNTTVSDGLTLAENLLQWLKTWLLKLDQPTSIPLATIKAVSATILQIQAALKQAFSGELQTALQHL